VYLNPFKCASNDPLIFLPVKLGLTFKSFIKGLLPLFSWICS
jgi:hypothetical protein